MNGITNFSFTAHARGEMIRRQIDERDVAATLRNPGQIETVRPGRMVYQSLMESGEPAKTYILRVFVDMDRDPVEVVTVYRTSKLSKYWRGVK